MSSADFQVAGVRPGIYPARNDETGLGYWNGHIWDPRPVAGIWTRVWCNAIDILIASILWIALSSVISIPLLLVLGSSTLSGGDDPLASALAISTLAIAFIGYFSLSYRLWSRTPGMMLGKLWVVSVPRGGETSSLSWGASLARATGLIMGYACGILTLIWLVATASSRTKQGPHDSMANTVVLRGQRYAFAPDLPTRSSTGWEQSDASLGEPGVTAADNTVQPSALYVMASASHEERASQSPGPKSVPNQGGSTPHNYRKKGSRAPLIVGLSIGAFAILAGFVVTIAIVDSRIRVSEMNQLLSAVEKTERVNLDYLADPQWEELSTRLQASQSRQNQSDAYYQRAWEDFVYGTVEVAQSYISPMQESILDVEAVSTLPWHSDIAAARDAYSDHAEVWLEAMSRRASHTPSKQRIEGLNEGLAPEISSTFAIAERRFRDVSILWAPESITSRIEQIFGN